MSHTNFSLWKKYEKQFYYIKLALSQKNAGVKLLHGSSRQCTSH